MSDSKQQTCVQCGRPQIWSGYCEMCKGRVAAPAPAPPAGERRKGGACELPPPGWRCSRDKGHDGPCAARPVAKVIASAEAICLLTAIRQAMKEPDGGSWRGLRDIADKRGLFHDDLDGPRLVPLLIDDLLKRTVLPCATCEE